MLWFFDQLNEDKFDMLLEKFGRKFFKKQMKKLDHWSFGLKKVFGDWFADKNEDNDDDRRRLNSVPFDVRPADLTEKVRGARNDRGIGGMKKVDFTNKTGRNLSHYNSDKLGGEKHCPMKKIAICCAAVWIAMVGSFLYLFGKTTKVMGRVQRLNVFYQGTIERGMTITERNDVFVAQKEARKKNNVRQVQN